MNKKSMKKELLILFATILVFAPIASAADFDHVIVNSEDWTDVYSAIHFANLQSVPADFLVSTPHGSLLLNGI